MQKINFDVSGLNGVSLTGIATYATNLIKTLQQDSDLEISGTYKLSRLKCKDEIKKFSNIKNITPLVPFFSNNFDIFHGTDFWIPSFGKYKKVVTIHDLTFYQENLYDAKYATYFQQRLEKMLLKSNPEHIIVVSDFIKNEFLERFPSFQNKITTVYHGADHFENFSSTKRLFDFPYIATIGMISKRKNIENLCKSFSLLSNKFPELYLIVCGALGSDGEEIKSHIIEKKLATKVIFTGYVNSENAQNIIKNAEMLAFPSLYEGFGFPILEAMSLKVPVITSNFGAMKEIAGNAAFYANPLDVEEFSDAMDAILTNNILKNELIAKGIERFNQFTWKKCAFQTNLVYKKM